MLKKSISALIVIIFLSGCSALLPTSKKTTKSPWNNFKEIDGAYCAIENYKTTKAQLHDLGFDPYKTANIKVLNHIGILEKFLINPSIKIENLDDGIQDCLEDEENCLAYEIEIDRLERKRYGSVLLDLFNFRKNTHETGWEFKALIVIDKDVVVYKVSESTPQIDNKEQIKNPLGPLQNMGSVLRRAVDK